MADELRLRQIVLNLLSNAIKFTPAGGSIRVATSPTPDGSLALSVADTGVGMTGEDIKTALTPFRQVGGSLNHSHEGSGLGLPLAKTLTELHGAAFDIASQLGVGSTMTITLPPQRVLAREPWMGAGLTRSPHPLI
ncbi:MAG: ATP-binding protein [Stellaceae bacterium]